MIFNNDSYISSVIFSPTVSIVHVYNSTSDDQGIISTINNTDLINMCYINICFSYIKYSLSIIFYNFIIILCLCTFNFNFIFINREITNSINSYIKFTINSVCSIRFTINCNFNFSSVINTISGGINFTSYNYSIINTVSNTYTFNRFNSNRCPIYSQFFSIISINIIIRIARSTNNNIIRTSRNN